MNDTRRPLGEIAVFQNAAPAELEVAEVNCKYGWANLASPLRVQPGERGGGDEIFRQPRSVKVTSGAPSSHFR